MLRGALLKTGAAAAKTAELVALATSLA